MAGQPESNPGDEKARKQMVERVRCLPLKRDAPNMNPQNLCQGWHGGEHV